MSITRRLILVGGGHAHLEVLRAASQRRFNAELMLVSASPTQLYSGMMPGQLRGAWSESALSIDLRRLCDSAGAQFIEGTVTRIEATTNSVSVHADGRSIDGSIASLDIGASVSGLALSGVREHAYLTRPIESWRKLVARADALRTRSVNGEPVACCVVGGGAAGVELAMALRARIGPNGRLTLISALPEVPAGFGAAVRSRVAKLLAQRGIALRLSTPVAAVSPSDVVLDDGERVPSALTVWATGAAAPSLLRTSQLSTDADGYLSVDDTLRSTDGSAVWGAGDCISMPTAPWMTKSGVYAVRAAPILAHNLRGACNGSGATMKTFVPQRHTMFILDTADERALLSSRWLTTHARWALAFKHSIDRRFVARYQR